MITVVILTCNRKKDLIEAIESIERSRGPERQIIIIDNGSTDGTSNVLACRKGLKVLRFEKGLELAKCRNAGIEAAEGDIIAFTDDDCIVAGDWLQRIEEDLKHNDAVGGTVNLYGEVKKPSWWDDEMNWMPGLTVPGLRGPLAGVVYLPQTANLAYRANVLKKLRFGEGLEGIWMKNMTREDSDLWIRTREGGYRTFIDTDLVVWHKLPASRFTLQFCIARAFSDGFAAYHRENGSEIWRHRLRFVLTEPFRIINRRLNRSPGSRVYDIIWMIREAGFVFAHLYGRIASASK